MDIKDRQALAKAFAEEAASAMETPETREAFATKIVKYLRMDVQQRDLAELMLTKDYFELGQTPEYTEFAGLKAHWHEPGSYAPRSAMTRKVFTVPTDMISVHPEYELGQLKSGRYGTILDQMDSARDEILGATNALVFNTIKGSIVSGDANYFAASGQVTLAALDQAISWVNDHSNGVKAIVGRRSRLDKILGLNTTSGPYSDRILDEIMRTGVLSIYKGAPVIGLPQYYDGFGQATISPDDIIVLGDNVGRYVVKEEVQQMNDIDIDTLNWHMHVWSRLGCAIFKPERAARIYM